MINDKALTVDMLRSFVTLAETLNLSVTAERLSTTRQTVRRHIDLLEEIKGGALFYLAGQSYFITELGEASVDDARALLNGLRDWADNSISVRRGASHLEYAEFTDDSGRKFLSQQHPVSHISRMGTERLRACFAAWGASAAQIGASQFDSVRSHLVAYRRSAAGWICVSVGKTSAYAEWFGRTWAESAIGRLVDEDRAGDQFNTFILQAYERIYATGSVRYDHLQAHLPRPSDDGLVPVTFQRLLMGCIFPDGTPALLVLVDITDEVIIGGLNDEGAEIGVESPALS